MPARYTGIPTREIIPSAAQSVADIGAPADAIFAKFEEDQFSTGGADPDNWPPALGEGTDRAIDYGLIQSTGFGATTSELEGASGLFNRWRRGYFSNNILGRQW